MQVFERVRRAVKCGERGETVAGHLHIDAAKLIDQGGGTQVLEDQEKVVLFVTLRKEALGCSNRDIRREELVEGDFSFVEVLQRRGRSTDPVERGDLCDETDWRRVAPLDHEAVAVRHLAVANARRSDVRDVAQLQVLVHPARVNLVNRWHERHTTPRSVCPRIGGFIRARCSDKNGPMQSFIQHYGYYALFAYEVGRSAGRTIVDRWGKWILVTHKDLDRGERWFEKYGAASVLISRVLPVVRSFISVPAGMAEMNRVRFAVLTTIGSAAWVALLAGLGYAAGKNWSHVSADFKTAEYPIIALVVLGLAFVLWHRIRSVRRDNEPNPQAS